MAQMEAAPAASFPAGCLKAGRLGLETREVYDLAFRRLALKEPITSLKELGEQKLRKLYDIIIRI
jgi:hypothetical protein